MQNDAYLTTSHVARIAEISEAQVRTLERTGVIPAVRTTLGARLFKREDIDAYIRTRPPQRKGRWDRRSKLVVAAEVQSKG